MGEYGRQRQDSISFRLHLMLFVMEGIMSIHIMHGLILLWEMKLRQ